MRLYLDACCLNRLTDDQSQARIRDEAEAVEAIFRMVRTGKATWVSSTALEIEINRNPDADRRHDVAALLALASEVVVPHHARPSAPHSFRSLGSTLLMLYIWHALRKVEPMWFCQLMTTWFAAPVGGSTRSAPAS